MRKFILVLAAISALQFADNASAAIAAPEIGGATVTEHGGGCRKSSPPGQCCHMDRKVGVVHCH